MRLLPKSIHRCRRYPTKFNSGRDISFCFVDVTKGLATDMLSDTQIEELALQLADAEDQRYQIAALTVSHPDLTMDEAYAIQKCWVDKKKIAGGRSIKGYKMS